MPKFQVATVGSLCTCAGSPPDTIVQGAPNVFVNGKPLALVGSMTAHGGVIIQTRYQSYLKRSKIQRSCKETRRSLPSRTATSPKTSRRAHAVIRRVL